MKGRKSDEWNRVFCIFSLRFFVLELSWEFESYHRVWVKKWEFREFKVERIMSWNDLPSGLSESDIYKILISKAWRMEHVHDAWRVARSGWAMPSYNELARMFTGPQFMSSMFLDRLTGLSIFLATSFFKIQAPFLFTIWKWRHNRVYKKWWQ